MARKSALDRLIEQRVRGTGPPAGPAGPLVGPIRHHKPSVASQILKHLGTYGNSGGNEMYTGKPATAEAWKRQMAREIRRRDRRRRG